MTEDIERDQRMQSTPAYKKSLKKKEDSDSAVHKAQQRTFESMKGFMLETGRRHKTGKFQTKSFEDTEELSQQCSDFLTYCMENEIVPTWSLLSVWLGCNLDTLYAITKLGDKRAEILQKAKTAIYTILEQLTTSGEGAPGGRIFLMKALWGLSDQQPIDINVNMGGQSQAVLPDDAENIINLTPGEWKTPGE
jgi:hypothetical protein